MSTIGDNSVPAGLSGVAAQIEDLEAQKRQLGEEIKDLYAAAKDAGLSPRALRYALKLKRLDEEKRLTQGLFEREVARYVAALGIESTPLWEAASALDRVGSEIKAGRMTIEAGEDR